jgi:hypothetical protein
VFRLNHTKSTAPLIPKFTIIRPAAEVPEKSPAVLPLIEPNLKLFDQQNSPSPKEKSDTTTDQEIHPLDAFDHFVYDTSKEISGSRLDDTICIPSIQAFI